MAKIARLTFQLNDGGKVAILFGDENGPEMTSWSESKAGDIHLLFDNDCHLPGVKDKCLQLLQQLGYRLQHTGSHNKQLAGLDDYIAVHESRLPD